MKVGRGEWEGVRRERREGERNGEEREGEGNREEREGD